ncbi:MAG: hypothetical protein FJ191_02830 [Gammaproteobacteria bacterium]|nr:hypothetical protein [Gammaproteobacteria bacterium]
MPGLRERVEALLPEWERWYPSLFDAAQDLGVIRARVCPPSALLLSRRHAAVYEEAAQAFRERWNIVEEGVETDDGGRAPAAPRPARRRRRAGQPGSRQR